jgi:hypothetical protein
MEILNFIIAVVALVVAVLAFQRTGGTKDLRKAQPSFWRKWKKRCEKKKQLKWRRKNPSSKQSHMGIIESALDKTCRNSRSFQLPFGCRPSVAIPMASVQA